MCKEITEFFNDFNILHEEYLQIYGSTELLRNLSFFALQESKGTVTGLQKFAVIRLISSIQNHKINIFQNYKLSIIQNHCV